MNTAPSSGTFMVIGVVYLAVILFLFIIPVWRIFSKAGEPGWGSIVPIYNIYLMCKICSRPGLWVLLCCIPLVNIIIGIVLSVDLAKAFGKGTGYAVGLIFLSPVFLPMLGYGKAEYKRAEAAPAQ